MCHQHVESVGHAVVQGGEAALIRHKVPTHERRRPGRAVKANAIENSRLIQEHVYVLSKQLAQGRRKQFEALVVIAGNDDRVLRSIGRVHALAQFASEDDCLLQ